jgi:hypothetical protein
MGGQLAIIDPKYGYLEGTYEQIRSTIAQLEAEDNQASKLKGIDPFYMYLPSDDRVVKGFEIKVRENQEYETFMTKSLFEELVELWLEPQMELETFKKECDENMCSDWNKQDIYNNCYGGYWKYEKDTYAYKNAYNLSREYSIYRMSVLPYPRKVLLRTIEIGCR